MAAIKDFDSLFRLDGKIAVVTGGSRGIGLYCATAFLQAGCSKVIITARNAENLAQAAAQLNALPNIRGRAVSIPANVGHTDQIEQFVRDVQAEIERDERPGRGLDILVANAAASWGGPFESFEDWKSVKTLDLNVRGVFNLCRLAATRADPSRILITSSVGGIVVPHVGERGAIMYSVSKAAAHHLGRNLALELVPKNITTNVIAPGFFPSRLANPQIDFLGGEDVVGSQNPMGRLGRPDDIAGLVVFLCSRAGSYVNGEDISLDGGARLRSGTHAGTLDARGKAASGNL
ncbi:Rhamnolipids biosynthesis 3-oxoacyl-[acyl-carrier-protein] reductase [Fonsecaea pedrosoi]|nr:Rhamnolipids biosynthesis 3-oxoacyl-[acyl-carrier-protein] reductase [Fonsecaea pedrosoi]